MHLPAAFHETRREAIDGFVRAHPFASVVAMTAHGLDASHLPLEWGDGVLRGHLARANDMAGLDGAPVLAMFLGEDAYITPNWYASKHETARAVPTWNYAAVHVHGRLRVIDDGAWLREFLRTLTARHEAGEPTPWSMDDAPADYLDALLTAIVGIEISIERVQAKFKFSQNKSAQDRLGVVNGLRQRQRAHDADVAARVARTLSDPVQP